MLTLAIENNAPQEDMPEVLYIISDMQFDVACGRNTKTNFEAIDQKYKAAGYERPKLVFWNVRASGNDNSPVKFDESGVAMVSGCSPSILKTLLGGTSFTPVDIMAEAVMAERYDAVVWE